MLVILLIFEKNKPGMKLRIIILCSLIIAMMQSCKEKVNQEFTGEDGEQLLLGKITYEGLNKAPYSDWFVPSYEAYEPDATIAKRLTEELKDYRVQVFMGTWCEDSQREVPALLRILHDMGFPADQLEIIAINDSEAQYKQSPGGEEKGLNIHHVPTIILFKDGKEINRIIEYPKESLEADLVQILDGTYTPYYNTANLVNDRLSEWGLRTFIKNIDQLAAQLKGGPEYYGELNTYSKVLFFSGRQEEAVAVARLNLMLFTDDAYAHAALARRLHDSGQNKEALEHISTAIDMEPDDMQFKELLDAIRSSS